MEAGVEHNRASADVSGRYAAAGELLLSFDLARDTDPCPCDAVVDGDAAEGEARLASEMSVVKPAKRLECGVVGRGLPPFST